MKKNLIHAFFLLACAVLPASAEGEQMKLDTLLTGHKGFWDPVFQDCIETSAGYLNSSNTMNLRSDPKDTRGFRDSVISAPVSALRTPAAIKIPVAAARALPEERTGLPALPAGHYKVTFAGESGPVGSYVRPLDSGSRKYAREYVLLGVAVGEGSYDKLLPRLEAAGLRFAGEKISYGKKDKKTVILGWAPYASMAGIARIAGVTGVAVEKKSTGMPLKAKVRFTLKVPYQNKPNVFVPEFIKGLAEKSGFDSDNWFRLPQKSAESKFSVFNVTGTLPVDMIGELSRSPFVASVEFNDASL